jgi:RNA polymerase sigma factor (sigma-70 family)
LHGTALQSLLRHALAGSGNTAACADAELVHRFAHAGDADAFGLLVARHGTMVWAVCRQMLPDDADADDAFQATFLTLLRSVPTLRGHGSLAGWLHRVAYRVALKARRATTRRRSRERAVAVGEATSAVADSAWDRMLGAVHDEVNRLPDALRVPFVMCCLEGQRVSDAAAALGWKLGTVSARLTRAKQRVLDRLARRGLPLAAAAGAVGLAATTGSAAVPVALLDQTVALHGAAGPIAPAVLQLSLGVMDVKLKRILLVGTLLVAIGMLVTGVGPALLPWATAQPAPKSPSPGADVLAHPPRPVSSKWEYTYVPVSQPVSQTGFEATCRELEAGGWEYGGTQEMTLDRTAGGNKGPKRGPQLVLVFKRVAGGSTSDDRSQLDAAKIDLQQANARIKALQYLAGIEAARKDAARSDRENARLAQQLAQLAGDDKLAADKAKKDLLDTKDAKAALADAEKRATLEAAQRVDLWLKKNPDAARRVDPPIVDGSSSTAVLSNKKPTAAPITIIPMSEGSAERMAKMLTELFGKQGTFQADDGSNSLVVKADAQTLEEVHQLIDRLEKQAQVKRDRDATMKEREKADLEKRYRAPKP